MFRDWLSVLKFFVPATVGIFLLIPFSSSICLIHTSISEEGRVVMERPICWGWVLFPELFLASHGKTAQMCGMKMPTAQKRKLSVTRHTSDINTNTNCGKDFKQSNAHDWSHDMLIIIFYDLVITQFFLLKQYETDERFHSASTWRVADPTLCWNCLLRLWKGHNSHRGRSVCVYRRMTESGREMKTLP